MKNSRVLQLLRDELINRDLWDDNRPYHELFTILTGLSQNVYNKRKLKSPFTKNGTWFVKESNIEISKFKANIEVHQYEDLRVLQNKINELSSTYKQYIQKAPLYKKVISKIDVVENDFLYILYADDNELKIYLYNRDKVEYTELPFTSKEAYHSEIEKYMNECGYEKMAMPTISCGNMPFDKSSKNKTMHVNKSKCQIETFEIDYFDIKETICNHLGIDPKVWITSDEVDVQRYIRDGLDNKKSTLNLDNLLPEFTKSNITKELSPDEIKLIEEHRQLSQEEIKKVLVKKKSTYSQKLLFKLVKIYYDRGFYSLIIDELEYEFSRELRENMQVKEVVAHSLGSNECKRYQEAYEMLQGLNDNIGRLTNETDIDKYTSFLSNVRRFIFLNEANQNLDQDLKKMIELYKEVFYLNDSYHYYPGINMAYLVKVYNSIENIEHSIDIDVKKIYKYSQKSILNDRNNEKLKHYAYITDVEFQILTSPHIRNNIYKLVQYYIENKISRDLIKRTLRQFEFFLKMYKDHEDKLKDELTLELSNIIETFQDVDYDLEKIDLRDFS